MLVVVLGVLVGAPAVALAQDDGRVLEASRRRDTKAVRSLVLNGADVDARQPDGTTGLLWAAHWDDLTAVRTLVEAGADVNAANELGATPLWLAAENGSAPIIEVLLAAGASPNPRLARGETPLMAAARAGGTAAVEALVAAGADIDAAETLRGQKALMWALSEGHLDAARVLLDHGADVHSRSKSGYTPLLFAVRQNDLDAVRLLLARGANVNDRAEDGSTPLVVATTVGYLDMGEFLLTLGADPNADGTGFTALHKAVAKWQTVTTPQYQHTPLAKHLFWIDPARRMEYVKLLLSHGAHPNARLRGLPPRYGANLGMNPGNGLGIVQGATPFFLAAYAGDVELMRLLVANGADPSLGSNDGTTPLIAAAGAFYIETENVVPESAYFEVVKLCIALGNDVNAANNQGNTALHATAFGGFTTVAQWLADQGADLNALNKAGRTPLDVAQRSIVSGMIRQQPAVAALLEQLGAKPRTDESR